MFYLRNIAIKLLQNDTHLRSGKRQRLRIFFLAGVTVLSSELPWRLLVGCQTHFTSDYENSSPYAFGHCLD